MAPAPRKAMFSTVKSACKMRFNKNELSALAAQPSHKFEKEGVLFVKERQEGFFRRTETSVERWCRLRGNLLFYFKSRDHLSEPAGVIVIEDCRVEVENSAMDTTFGIVLVFSGGLQQHLATYTEAERDCWTAALRSASHSNMRSHIDVLREKLRERRNTSPSDKAGASFVEEHRNVIDPGEAPLVEMSLSCDNLLCDALGRAPSARLIIHTRNPPEILWKKLAQTEVAEKSSNPTYLRTITFRSSDGVCERTEIRITAYDCREKLTSTCIQMGKAQIKLDELKSEGRTRLKLEPPNPEGRAAGFVTLTAWTFEQKVPTSTDSTPYHTNSSNSKQAAAAATGRGGADAASSASNGKSLGLLRRGCHRRTQSLPPDTQHPARLPQHKALTMIFARPVIKTYRFHSGLAGDINVQELMAESKLSFTFPQQLLSLWICEEKELVHEIAGLGELKSPWHKCQMTWLENHLNLINTYSQALENLDSQKGNTLRKSIEKGEKKFEFVPTNLHLQRMWVENESLRKVNVFDTLTHGAFTAMAQKGPGLIKMLKELKSPQKDSSAWCTQSDRLQLAEDTLAAVRRVRKEVVDCMRLLMKKGKDKNPEGMFALVEDMLRKTKCLCSLLDQAMVEEAFIFLEDNRITQRPEQPDEFSESVAEFMQRNKLKIDLPPLFRPMGSSSRTGANIGGAGLVPGCGQLQTPCSEFVSKELRTPEVDLMFGGESSLGEDFWRSYSAYTSGYQSVDRLSDIDEFEESFKYLSVIDKTKHYYTLCRTGSPIDTPVPTPQASPKKEVPSGAKAATDDDDEGIETNGTSTQPTDTAALDNTTEQPAEDESEASKSPMKEAEVVVDDEKAESSGEEEAEQAESTTPEEESSPSPEPTPPEIPTEDIATAATPVKNGAPKNPIEEKDQTLTSDSPNGLHYRAGDEPEPIDLTHLNIEAAMMCLASKVRVLCGRANSPTLSNRTFRFKELDAQRKSTAIPKSSSHDSTFKIPDVPKPGVPGECQEIEDWASELRPSMRKLRQGMDCLCKTARLMCSVLRLQQLTEAVNLSHGIKYRRDVCFSQALTSLVTALMAKFWACEADPTFLHICTKLGPLVSFESLLSLHGEDVAIFGDMLVAVEDLRNVEFTLILVDKRSKAKLRNGSGSKHGSMPMILPYHSFPLPRVTGSRSSLKVMLPVPDYVYTLLPLEQMKTLTFNVTPVFFNIGINEQATIAGKFGNNGPQEKNNIDNFKILSDYYRRLKKLDLPHGHLAIGERQKRHSMFSSNEPDIDDLLAILKNEVNNRRNKNVEILHLSSLIVRRLSGFRFSNCKSGKDRTGMSVTLEQVQILSREFDLAEHEYQRALDVMRSEGTRRTNVIKNIGDNKYAFNTLQLATFPFQYKPPVGTYGSKMT